MESTTTQHRGSISCFLSVPFGLEIEQILKALSLEAIRPILLTEQQLRTPSLSKSLATSIGKADLVLGINSSDPPNANVMFEVGYAYGLGKPIVLVTENYPDFASAPLDDFIILRATPDNTEAMLYAIRQIVPIVQERRQAERLLKKKPSSSERTAETMTSTLRKKLGPDVPDLTKTIRQRVSLERTSRLLAQLDMAEQSGNDRSFEDAVASALEDSGVQIARQAAGEGARSDIVAWVDELTTSMGNPIRIEIKGPSQPVASVDQQEWLDQIAGWRPGPFLVVVYSAKHKPSSILAPPNVLFLSATELVEKLHQLSFWKILLEVRNRQAHGIA